MRNKLAVLVFLATAGAANALGKAGVDPGAPAGGGDFVAGNAAVAADVNKQINILYKAFNDGTNSINIDSWTNTAGALGYTGGGLGVGIASPSVKFQVDGGTTVTTAAATGYGVFGLTNGLHVAIDTTKVQAKLNETTAATLNLNSLGGNIVTGSGNFGVGTSPSVKFQVNGGTAVTLAAVTGFAAFGTTGSNHIAIDTAQIQAKSNITTATNLYLNPLGGNVGIGTASPAEILDVGGNIKSSGTVMINAAAGNARKVEIYTNNLRRWSFGSDAAAESGSHAGSDFEIRRFQDSGGAFGNPIVLKFTRSNGLLQLPLYNAGTLTSDASGNITVSSDGRMKDIIGKTETGLSAVLQMQGKKWRWKSGMGMETHGVYEGFIAQDIERLVPLAVGGKADGMKSLAYHTLLPTFANAIRELKSEKDSQILALEKRASLAEVALRQAQGDRERSDARAKKLERRLAEQGQRLAEESQARKQQEIRLARLEQALQKQVIARR